MTTSNHLAPDRIISIGPRQLDILRLLWEHGPATVTQLHAWLHADPPIAYTTVQTACVTLATKGLLVRSLQGQANMYEPAIGPAVFTQVLIGRTGRMLAPYMAEPIATAHTESADAELTALRTRVATAEQSAMHWESVAHRAERRIEALERRAQAAERRAEQAERRLTALQKQLDRPPRPRATPHPPHEEITEHRGPGVCRVCGELAPRPRKRREDGLRVCGADSCSRSFELFTLPDRSRRRTFCMNVVRIVSSSSAYLSSKWA